MKVILLADVKTLGRRGAVVDVSDGYARNFLFPQNLGVQATEDSIRRLREQEEAAERRTKKGMSLAGKAAQKIEGYELVLKEKVSDGGKLYAAVSPKTIAKALKKAGFEVDEAMVELKSPIKDVGEREVAINLPHGFEATITVRIEAA